jgi:hypothetical protein
MPGLSRRLARPSVVLVTTPTIPPLCAASGEGDRFDVFHSLPALYTLISLDEGRGDA